MQILWETKEGSSKEIWDGVNERLKEGTISRASIINFLNAMVDDGPLAYHEITGKGGHRRIYRAAMTEQQYWTWLMEVVDTKLKEASGFPW